MDLKLFMMTRRKNLNLQEEEVVIKNVHILIEIGEEKEVIEIEAIEEIEMQKEIETMMINYLSLH